MFGKLGLHWRSFWKENCISVHIRAPNNLDWQLGSDYQIINILVQTRKHLKRPGTWWHTSKKSGSFSLRLFSPPAGCTPRCSSLRKRLTEEAPAQAAQEVPKPPKVGKYGGIWGLVCQKIIQKKPRRSRIGKRSFPWLLNLRFHDFSFWVLVALGTSVRDISKETK